MRVGGRVRSVVVALTLVVWPSTAAAGPNRAAQGACSSTISYGDTLSGCRLANEDEVDRFTFSASAGDHIVARTVDDTGDIYPVLEVLGPDGRALACDDNFGGYEQVCVITRAGSHALAVREAFGTPASGTYSVSLVRTSAPATCEPIVPGDRPHDGTLTVAAEVDCFTFSASAGDHVVARTIDDSGTIYPVLDVVGPDGRILDCDDNFGGYEQVCVITRAGSHALIVREAFSGPASGTYSVSLVRTSAPATCEHIAPGDRPHGGAIEVGAEVDCFTFSASAGDHVVARTVDDSGDIYPVVDVVGPDGRILDCDDNFGGYEQVCVITRAGSHALIVREAFSGPASGTYSVALVRTSAPATCEPIVLGGPPREGTIDVAAEIDCFTFSAVAGEHVYARSYGQSGGLVPAIDVIGPDGNVVDCKSSAVNFGEACELPAAGVYAVIVREFFSGPVSGIHSTSVANNDVVVEGSGDISTAVDTRNSRATLTHDYGLATPSRRQVCTTCRSGEFAELGSYGHGDELVFYLRTHAANGSTNEYLSTDPERARIWRLGANEWVIEWEDATDGNYVDLVTRVWRPEDTLAWVALGDSYSSGEGNPPFTTGTDVDGNRCHRSRAGAYPQIVHRRGWGDDFVFRACSGARIRDFYIPQNETQKAQLSYLREETDVVTLSIGGNDMGFAEILKRCSHRENCHDHFRDQFEDDLSRLRVRLDDLFPDIREKVRPDTAVLVLDYPQIFPVRRNRDCPWRLRGFRQEEINWLRSGTTRVNDVIEEAAGEAGLGFVEVEHAFARRSVCSKEPFANAIDLSDVEHSFHPNTKGHNALANFVDAAFGEVLPD